jgi:hypothetical protein
MRGVFVDEGPTAKRSAGSILGRVAVKLGGWGAVGFTELHNRLLAESVAFVPDVVLIVKGAHVPPSCLRQIKVSTGAVLVNFATDDPFNPKTSSRRWLSALPEYDLVCTPRQANVPDLNAIGVSNVQVVPFAYKPDVHFEERSENSAEEKRFRSDVCFIGGADADRFPYFEELVSRVPDINLALYGGYWDRSRRLAPFWRGFAVGREFRLAVGGASLSVNLVRRANRDDHVMRTFEVPACGGCMLTEATPTHVDLFREGEEAFFFDSPATFVDKVRYLLARPELCRRTARAGRLRILESGNRYDDRLTTIVRLSGETRRVSSATGQVCLASA